MYIGNFEITKEKISIALMIIFAMAMMFFLGYKYAYDKSISYANEQIGEKVEEFKMMYGIQEGNTDFMLGNIDYPIGGKDEE